MGVQNLHTTHPKEKSAFELRNDHYRPGYHFVINNLVTKFVTHLVFDMVLFPSIYYIDRKQTKLNR